MPEREDIDWRHIIERAGEELVRLRMRPSGPAHNVAHLVIEQLEHLERVVPFAQEGEVEKFIKEERRMLMHPSSRLPMYLMVLDQTLNRIRGALQAVGIDVRERSTGLKEKMRMFYEANPGIGSNPGLRGV